MKGTDSAQIKSATEALQQKFYEISAKLYQQQAPNVEQGGQPNAQQQGDNVYDADFTDNTDNK